MESNENKKDKRVFSESYQSEFDNDKDNVHLGNKVDEEESEEGRYLDENFDGALDDYCVDDIDNDAVMQLTFPSENDAELFYNTYAKAVGFSIRKSDYRMHNAEIVKTRKWVCSCEGKREEKWDRLENRKRQPKAVTRTGCKAMFRIKLVPEMGHYIVTAFSKEHNHRMTNKSSVLFMRLHRKVSEADYAQAKSMRQVGVRTSQIMKFFVLKAGGYENVKFLMKDLYNKMSKEMEKEIVDGDAEGAIAYLAGKQVNDPMFFYKFKLDDERHLCTLFWADSKSRSDYRCFGDVLVFYSTFKTNEYGKPLVVMAGVNNHFQTVIFACVLVPEETSETYEWVLETFIDAMDGKKPNAVVTDGDRAMRKAIKKIIPEAKHRLYCWHFRRNAVSNVKCKEFLTGLDKCMYSNISEEKFEDLWGKLVKEFGLEDNEWVKMAYRRRYLWSNAFLRGHFFAGMKSTQRCEKMNDLLKIHLKEKMRLFEFVQAFDLGILCLRHQEEMQQHETEHTTMVMATKFECLERHAMEAYTRRIFLMVREELSCSSLFNPLKFGVIGNERVYLLNKYGEPESRWRIDLNMTTMEMRCSCMTFESIGLPCAHMFKVMELKHMKTIPQSCILNRWRPNAKSRLHSRHDEKRSIVSGVTQIARYGNLCGECEIMCYYASQTIEGYDRILDLVHRETKKMKETCESNGEPVVNGCGELHECGGKRLFGVKDPAYTKAKGDRKENIKSKQLPSKCGKCGLRDGHNTRTCNKRAIASSVRLDEGLASDDSEFEYTRQHDPTFDLNFPYSQNDDTTRENCFELCSQNGFQSSMQSITNQSIYQIYEPIVYGDVMYN